MGHSVVFSLSEKVLCVIVQRSHNISFSRLCQRTVLVAFLTAVLPAAAPAGEAAPAVLTEEQRLASVLRALSRFKISASLSLNWRNVGPREPGFETQIQNEVYLADLYFGIEGPFIEKVPVKAEWHVPTGSQGRVQLNQAYFDYRRLDRWSFQFGKFIVPFGRYNELYRPDQFLTVTRPLLYASADSLDLVVRINSPRPVLSYGYTDIGARTSYYPARAHPLVPSEVTLFVVNGLGETSNRQRTFPDPENLGIQPPPGNGVNIDFAHRNNNLADNNNNKAFGGRVAFALGDLRLPWPIPEDSGDLQGVLLGVSGMNGQYDLEGVLGYQMYGVDWSFDYHGFNISGEYGYSLSEFLAPLKISSGALAVPINLVKDFEINHGYFVQAAFPLMRRPPWGKRVTGVFVFNQMFRRGPLLDLFLNHPIDGTVHPSLRAADASGLRITRRIDKYTAAVNWLLTENFRLKFDYSYWVMGRSSTVSARNPTFPDIYQGALSMVLGF